MAIAAAGIAIAYDIAGTPFPNIYQPILNINVKEIKIEKLPVRASSPAGTSSSVTA